LLREVKGVASVISRIPAGMRGIAALRELRTCPAPRDGAVITRDALASLLPRAAPAHSDGAGAQGHRGNERDQPER
jgi:hypothetical protein